MTERPKAVLATVSSDSHSWNLIYIQMVLEEAGYEVVNLGPCSSVEYVAQSVGRIVPRLVVISSVNGHGYIEAPAYAVILRAMLSSTSTLLVIGGRLTTSEKLRNSEIGSLRQAGFDAVLVGSNAVPEFRQLIFDALVADDAVEAAGVGGAW